MSKKKKIITISAIIAAVVLIGIFTAIYVVQNLDNNSKATVSQTEKGNDKSLDTLTSAEKEIAGIKDEINKEEIKKENYSTLYKEYLDSSKDNNNGEVKKDNGEVIPRKQDVPFEKLEEVKEKLEKEDKTKIINGIPENFNLADKIKLKVENQGMYGLCWDFACMKSLETYLALNNLGDYDLSEIHLDYIESNLMYGNREVHEGGNFSNFKNYIAESGVVLESDAPYREHSEKEYNKFTDMKKVVEITETIEFPTLYKDENCKYTEDEITEFRNNVKKHIMKNGGLYCVIATPDFGTKYFNEETSAECFLGDRNDLTRGREIHAVTIVGWDDNYSRENFNEGMRPTKDGAYIVLNSWGDWFGKNGYYYVSYEDRYVESDLSGIVSTSMEDAYKISSIKNQTIKDYLTKNYEYLFINYEGENYITKNVISNIYSLDLSNSNMTTLEDIEMFTNVYSLYLSNNSITDITPLTKLNSLSSIDLSNNNIVDITPLKDMKTKSLYSINLSNNKIKDVSAINYIKNEYDSLLDLDISGNIDVKGYEQLNNINQLNISDCNVKDISDLKKCDNISCLIIKNSPGIKGLDNLSEKIYFLDVSNCDLEKITTISNTKISNLNVSNNKLTTLDGIQKFTNINNLDVSGNSISDWSALKDITKVNLYDANDVENQEYEYYDQTRISADNCNIEDITIFNDLNISTALSLRNNKIKDVSKFNNEKIYFIDLSNNEDITGLQGLSKVPTLFLNNCNISDMSEVLKLENVINLSLENNKLEEIDGISKLKKLEMLSLAGNKIADANFSNNRLLTLNVSDCNLNNGFDFGSFTMISYLNISKNPRLNCREVFNEVGKETLTLVVDECDLEDIEKIKTEFDINYVYIMSDNINLNYTLPKNQTKIDLNKNKVLKREIMKSIAKGQVNVQNGHLNKNGYIIDIEDTTKESVEIKLGWSSNFSNSTIKIIFNANAGKTESNTETNIIKDNTLNKTKNNTTNVINNENTINNTNTNTTNVIDNENTTNNTNTTNVIDNENTTNNTNTNTTNVIDNENTTNNTNTNTTNVIDDENTTNNTNTNTTNVIDNENTTNNTNTTNVTENENTTNNTNI